MVGRLACWAARRAGPPSFPTLTRNVRVCIGQPFLGGEGASAGRAAGAGALGRSVHMRASRAGPCSTSSGSGPAVESGGQAGGRGAFSSFADEETEAQRGWTASHRSGLEPEADGKAGPGQGRPEPRCGRDVAQCSEQALLVMVRGILPGVVITPALSGEPSAATCRQVPRPKASDAHTERFPGWWSRVSPARRLSSLDASVPGCWVRFCIFTYPALLPGALLGAFVVLGHRSPACVGRGGGASQPAQGEAASTGQLSLHLCCSLHLLSALRGAVASCRTPPDFATKGVRFGFFGLKVRKPQEECHSPTQRDQALPRAAEEAGGL